MITQKNLGIYILIEKCYRNILKEVFTFNESLYFLNIEIYINGIGRNFTLELKPVYLDLYIRFDLDLPVVE